MHSDLELQAFLKIEVLWQRILLLLLILNSYINKKIIFSHDQTGVILILRHLCLVPLPEKRHTKVRSCSKESHQLVKDISHLNYEYQLRQLGLPTLEYRRDRNDMIQVYKAIHAIDDINWMSLYMLVPSTATRDHSLKIFKKQCRTTEVTHLLHEDNRSVEWIIKLYSHFKVCKCLQICFKC